MGVADSVAGGASAGLLGGPVGALIGAGIGLFGSLFGAHEQSSAATKAAQISSDAQLKAAAMQQQSAEEALTYEKQQAALTATNAEIAQHGNYDQYAARENRLGTLGQMMGLGPRDIPAYRPMATDLPAGSVGAIAGAPGSPAPTTGASGSAPAGDITGFLTNVYKSLGVAPTGPGTGPTDIAYMASKVQETGGLTPQNQSYWPQRIADELAKAKGGAAPTTAPAPYAPGSIGAMVQPQKQPLTPALTANPYVYTPGSLGSFAAGQGY